MTALFTLTDFALTVEKTRPHRIDYARMQQVWPKQKRALAAAVRTADADRIAAVCIAAIQVWDEIGAWPDDWALFQRALDDALPWHRQITLTDLAYRPTTETRS
jgi:hypothetical protein